MCQTQVQQNIGQGVVDCDNINMMVWKIQDQLDEMSMTCAYKLSIHCT